MSSKNKLGFVIVQELFDSIRSKLDDVASAIRVSDEVRLNTQFLVIVGWIAPQNVHDQLLLRSADLVNDLQWSLNQVNLVNVHQSASNASMQTYNLLFNDCSQWQPVEQVIDLVKH